MSQELELEIERLQQRIVENQAAVENVGLRLEIDRLKDSTQAWKQSALDTSKVCDTLRAENERLNKIVAQFDSDWNALRGENTTLRARVESLESQLVVMTGVADRRADERDSLKMRVEELEALYIDKAMEEHKERDELRTLFDRSKRDLDFRASQVVDLEQQLAELHEENGRLRQLFIDQPEPKAPTVVEQVELYTIDGNPAVLNILSDGTVRCELEGV